MATNDNIKHYSAVDIEKYHRGLLSPSAMHEMEKAALEDPFLADAMDGYSTPGADVATDIAELQKRLAAKTEDSKVMPLLARQQKSIPWLRIAALIVVIAGAGLLTYQLAFRQKEKPLAKNNNPVVQPERQIDSVVKTPANDEKSNFIKTEQAPVSAKKEGLQKQQIDTAYWQGNDDQFDTQETKKVRSGNYTKDETEAITSAAPNTIAEKNDRNVMPRQVNDKSLAKESKTTNYSTLPAQGAVQQKKAEDDSVRLLTQKRKAADKFFSQTQASSVFRGRVTDQHNAGVPFANVTVTEENTGTYTDANGFFNLTSPDSVLNVQVRSIGFENSNTLLKNNVATNHVVLQDDNNTLAEIVIGNKLPNTAQRSRDANRTLEELEPADGWTNYDVYLANNLNAPDDYKPKPTVYPSVEISFELDANGEPTNFKVEKSLCAKCDQEAIRLIKEGPKWKQNASKHGRTRVTINF